MRALLNVIWLLFGGLWLALGYVLFGILACIFIITIPFGVASFRMASYALWPFGRTVVRKPTAGTGSALANVIWFLVAGVWLAVEHVVTAIAQAITIVGIPLAIANLKMIPVTVVPFGKEIVPSDAIPYGMQPAHSVDPRP
ncbi:YccF domain-containing protein [Georgenia halophila]